MTPQTVRLRWNSTFSKDDIEHEAKPEKGVYQFYGNHPVYGRHVLLYIESADDVKKELSDHGYLRTCEHAPRVPDIQMPGHVTIKVAYHKDQKMDVNTPELISEAVELLLIFGHSPAWNDKHIDPKWKTKNVKRIRKNYSDLEIHNEGDCRGSLLDVVKASDLFYQYS